MLILYRAMKAATAAALGLGLVYWAAPNRPPATAVVSVPETTNLPRAAPRARKALANGLPVSYESAVSDRSPSEILREFQAGGLTELENRPLPTPSLQGLPALPGGLTAIRWVRTTEKAPPTLEALLVFGEKPAVTFRMAMGTPPSGPNAFDPARDLEGRLGTGPLGLRVTYALVDGDGSWSFLGEDPGRKALGPVLADQLERAGWSKGLSSPRLEQGVSCFSRWGREVCILREVGGAISISMGMGSPVFQPGLRDDPFLSQALFQKGTE